MTIKDLHQKLIEAYTLRNLNRISLTLILLYKNKQFSILQKIANILEDFFDIEIGSNGKGFSKLIKLYHPDRLDYYLNDIQDLFEKNNFDGMLEHTHILKLERIEEISSSLNSYEDMDYSPVYDWDSNADGYNVIHESEKPRKTHTKSVGYNFYDAIKMRQYGNTDIEFPSYYLEDIEDFELASSDITDLEGVQYCLHAKSMDLSDNRIVDLELLENLGNLEELNLSDNQIEHIDSLGNLINLRRIFLSNNNINDISSLLELENLDFVELTGNKIPLEQIEELKESGVVIEI